MKKNKIIKTGIKLATLPLLLYQLMQQPAYTNVTDELQETSTPTIRSQKTDYIESHHLKFRMYNGERPSLETAENIIKEYGFLVAGAGYSIKDLPIAKSRSGTKLRPHYPTIEQFIINELEPNLKNYDQDEIGIGSIHCIITDYSKLEEIILDPRFIIGGAGGLEENNASYRIGNAKDAFLSKNYPAAQKLLLGAIDYIQHTKDHQKQKESRWNSIIEARQKLIEAGEDVSHIDPPPSLNEFQQKSEISEGMLFMIVNHLLGKNYQEIGDYINAELAYLKALEIARYTPFKERTELARTLERLTEKKIEEIRKIDEDDEKK